MLVKSSVIVGLVVSFGLISCRKDIDNQTIYDVILVVGQSNNYYGDNLDDLEPFKVSESIKQLGRYDSLNYQIIPATEPLQNYTLPINKGCYVLTFANLYSKTILKNNHKILIIPCAKWGTSFIENDWNKGDKLYRDAIERTNYVLSHFRKSKLTAILWHQGESDIENSNYQTDLDNFILNIRKDINQENTPFILGGMVPFWVKQNSKRIAIQNIIKNTPTRLPNTAYANPQFPFIIDKYDNSIDSLHYSAKGLRELGQRYFTEFMKYN